MFYDLVTELTALWIFIDNINCSTSMILHLVDLGRNRCTNEDNGFQNLHEKAGEITQNIFQTPDRFSFLFKTQKDQNKNQILKFFIGSRSHTAKIL